MSILIYLGLGAFAGVAAGLFGIGGGLLIVPVLIFSFSWQGMNAEILTHVAVATSLATIVFTSLSSIWNHHRYAAVRWDLLVSMALGIVLGAALGAMFAALLTAQYLQSLFGIFSLLVAMHMWFSPQIVSTETPLNKSDLAFGGLGIGALSAVFGIGGGTLTVPFLNWKKIKMQQAVATAAACGLPIALSATLTNIWQGWNNPQLAEGSLGFIYMPAVIGIVVTSTYFAKWGVCLAHRLSAFALKRYFALFLLASGLYFIGRNFI